MISSALALYCNVVVTPPGSGGLSNPSVPQHAYDMIPIGTVKA